MSVLKFVSILFGLLGLVNVFVHSFPYYVPVVPLHNFSNICGKNQFRCDSGHGCIENNQLCDGFAHCPDKSDETIFRCSRIQCPPFHFQCSYGACIPNYKVLDGKFDCVDLSDENIGKLQQNLPCGKGNFQCKCGECIDKYSVCDGLVDCSDGSDETVLACQNMNCMMTNFQCAYGACVNGDAPCNGIQECADASDEADSLCFPKSTTTATIDCIVPPHPKNESLNIENKIVKASNFVILKLKCSENHALIGNSTVTCHNGIWDQFPECQELCRPQMSETLDIKCYTEDIEVPCDQPMVPLTISIFQCKPNYEPLVPSNYNSSVCMDGSWDRPLYKCIQKQPTSPGVVNNYNYYIKIFISPNQLHNLSTSFLNNMNFSDIEIYDLNKYSPDFLFPR